VLFDVRITVANPRWSKHGICMYCHGEYGALYELRTDSLFRVKGRIGWILRDDSGFDLDPEKHQNDRRIRLQRKPIQQHSPIRELKTNS
jgi:hypothetical protein